MKHPVKLTYLAGVSSFEMDRRNEIIEAIKKRKCILRREAYFLLLFDQKYRRCNNCGRTFEECQDWSPTTFPNRLGNAVPCGLKRVCRECELQEIITGSHPTL